MLAAIGLASLPVPPVEVHLLRYATRVCLRASLHRTTTPRGGRRRCVSGAASGLSEACTLEACTRNKACERAGIGCAGPLRLGT